MNTVKTNITNNKVNTTVPEKQINHFCTNCRNNYNYSSAPTLPSFDKYNDDHFECNMPQIEITKILANIFLELMFNINYNHDMCEYQITNSQKNVIIRVAIYRDIRCGHVIEFNRENGRKYYRQEVCKIWNALHQKGITKIPMVLNENYNGLLSEEELANHTCDRYTKCSAGIEHETSASGPECRKYASDPESETWSSGSECVTCSKCNEPIKCNKCDENKIWSNIRNVPDIRWRKFIKVAERHLNIEKAPVKLSFFGNPNIFGKFSLDIPIKVYLEKKPQALSKFVVLKEHNFLQGNVSLTYRAKIRDVIYGLDGAYWGKIIEEKETHFVLDRKHLSGPNKFKNRICKKMFEGVRWYSNGDHLQTFSRKSNNFPNHGTHFYQNSSNFDGVVLCCPNIPKNFLNKGKTKHAVNGYLLYCFGKYGKIEKTVLESYKHNNRGKDLKVFIFYKKNTFNKQQLKKLREGKSIHFRPFEDRCDYLKLSISTRDRDSHKRSSFSHDNENCEACNW